MNPPEEFRVLTQYFWQGSRQEFGSHEDWVRDRVGLLTPQERIAVKLFLDELLAHSSEEELQAAWRSGNSDYWFKPIRPFFIEMRDLLNEA